MFQAPISSFEWIEHLHSRQSAAAQAPCRAQIAHHSWSKAAIPDEPQQSLQHSSKHP